MSITSHLDRYLSVRRSLGYDLRTDERVLRRFARYADQEGASHIDAALFLRWDASLPAVGASTRSARLGKVRLFAQWLSSIDPAHEVPPRGLLPGRSGRSRPYIYSEAEIAAIIAAAKALPSIYGLRGLTCSTLFGLIAVTGLRISEALALDGARHGKPPVKLMVEDIDADLVADFLVHGETARGNSARSRNTRLAAIRSFFRYVAMTDPAKLLHCQRILAMPNKRYVKRTVTFLDAEEIAALLAAPDRTTWAGRRDHVLLLLAIQTGLRASELVNLRCGDVVLGSGAHIRCIGKGRKERCTPLHRDTAKLLAAWIGDRAGDNGPLFPSIRGEKLSRDALEHLVRKHCLTASRTCPSLGAKRVTPHTLRHSTAMDLLHHGVDQAVIALWLGHESVATTQVYIHADMRMKERALARVAAPTTPTGRFQPDDQLLAFLEGL